MPNAIRPMLALRHDHAGPIKFPVLAQPKLDGIRALIVDGQFQSRSGKPIANKRIQQLLELRFHGTTLGDILNGLDGELVFGSPLAPHSYRKTSSCVNSHLGSIDGLNYYVYDLWKGGQTAHQRAEMASIFVVTARRFGQDWIKNLGFDLVENSADLEELESRAVAAGYEGIVTRHVSAPYHNGRSGKRAQQLLKFKRFEDIELEVIDYEEQRTHVGEQEESELGYAKRGRKAEDMVGAGVLGALVCKWNDSTVRVGTGFSASERLELWSERSSLPGRLAKVRYMPHGTHEKPRHPSFQGWRSPDDLGE